MKKDKIKKKYNRVWGKQRNKQFLSYERNRRLGEFFTKKGKVLDVACGDGTVGLWLQNQGFAVVGIDISSVALKIAQKRGLQKTILADVEEDLPFKAESFDYVFCGDILEHLFDPLGLLLECKRVLRKGGFLVVSCPNMGYWYYRLVYLVKGQVPKTEGAPGAPWEWEHVRFFNQQLILKLIKKAGFSSDKVAGACRRPLDHFLAGYWPAMFASILIVKAEKR